MKAFLILALLSTFARSSESQTLLNGKDLSGWEGNPELWSVKDGVITGTTTPEKPAATNTFLIWKGGEVSDFKLTLKYKMTPGDDKGFVNSGIQFRSRIVDAANWVVAGYQADFEYGSTYSGILYEEKGRGILAQRGQKVKISQGGEPSKPTLEVTGETGKGEDIQAAIKKDDWNEYTIIAKGKHIRHMINGKTTIEVEDNTAEGAKQGLLALQLHAGPPMQVQFKDIVLITK
jgi:Domain of Unknown Function (DUF1080)